MNKRTISCKDCEYYSVREILGKDNKIIKKDYCKHFRKELSSLKPCKRFVEPESTIDQVAVFPISFFIVGIIVSIILLITKGWTTSTIIVLLITLLLLIFCAWFFFIYHRE